MRIAFQMEYMNETQNGETHTLLMMEEACARGYEVFHYHPDTLSLSEKGITARLAQVHVDLSQEEYYSLQEDQTVDMSTMDVVLFRQDPPFDMNYFTNTLILEELKKDGVLFVNDPYWIRNMPDKHTIFDFKDFLPPTLVSQDIEEIEKFFAAHKDIVIKPLYSFHGHGIHRSDNIKTAKDMLEHRKEPLMFQPFLPEVYEGNKRFLFFDGDMVGAIITVPEKDGDFRIYRESKDLAYEATPEEQELCNKIGKMLKERGLIFVGIDLIGKYLTEINVGSVGSLWRFNEIYGGKWEAKLWDAIERKLKSA